MSTLTIHPGANGVDTSWSNVGGSSKFASSQLPHDDGATYVVESHPNIARQSFYIAAQSGGTLPLPTTATISSITGNVRSRKGGTNAGVWSVDIRVYARTDAGTADTSTFNISSTSFANFSATLPRPGGGAWTPTDVNDSDTQIGVRTTAWNGSFGGGTTSDARATTVWATIDLTLAAPTATTGAATSVSTTTATLNGTINPNGANAGWPVSYYFEWGPTAAYGNTTTLVGGQTGSADIAVNAALTGLAPGTAYHFRVVSTNADNTTNGADQAFTTSSTETILMVF